MFELLEFELARVDCIPTNQVGINAVLGVATQVSVSLFDGDNWI